MSWSREDIIAHIETYHKDSIVGKIDVSLPYWELRNKYVGARHIIHLIGSGMGQANGACSRWLSYPPPNKKAEG